MITYLKSETERLEKGLSSSIVEHLPCKEKVGGAIPSSALIKQELSTLIKTSWIFARKSEDEINKEIERYRAYKIDGEKDRDTRIQAKAIYLELIELKDKKLKLIEIISYCEAKAKEHKIDLEDGE
jgi:hypothetical protein